MPALSELIDAHAASAPDAPAFVEDEEVLSWAGYAHRSDRLAGLLVGLGLAPFTGRAVIALACDPDVSERSGRALTCRDLAEEYGFRDLDGRLPPGPLHDRPGGR